MERSARPVSFRLLSSAADITDANPEQVERLVRQQLESDTHAALSDDSSLLAQLQSCLADAVNFGRALPAEDRTIIRTEFNTAAWAQLDEPTRDGVRMLTERLTENRTLDGLTASVYAVPKLLEGLPADAGALKKAQRAFFKALYQLLCSRDTGPRLPTLLLSIGPDRARSC
ncbi:hypothetical protein [Nocardia blacklockiae]|uniref:hypothetical protein n=1 Tax=Nocardia blacklockiae TaxID=480036 RepID=UPI00189546A3|nr:hypothetical protein [Nocardia blacklockiae]MBF6171039.1 hypothetical protein [Nocardia blacklockiae]